MLPVLPKLAGLAGNAVAGGANAVARGAGAGAKAIGRGIANAGRTATRRINTSITNAINNANAGGGNNNANAGLDTNSLQEATQLLQQVVDKLKEATTQTQNLQTESSKLSKIWHGMGNILNKVLVTPLKSALGFLVKMLKTARNLVMAFGAMTLAAGFSYNNNGKEARRGRISNKNLEAYNRAKALQGISEDELNLGQLQSYIGSHEGYKLAYFGINREEIAKMSGLDAMEHYRQKVGEWLAKQNPNAPIDPTALSIIQASSNVDVANDEGKRIFTNSTWGDIMKDYKMFVKQIPDTSALGKAQRSIALLKFKFKDFLAHIAVAFAPLINGVLDKIVEWTNKVDLGKIAGFLSPIIETLTTFTQSIISKVTNSNLMNTLSKLFSESNINALVDGIVKVSSALAEIAEKILPYFLEGLNVLGAILQDLANFLRDPQAWWDEKKGVINGLAQGKMAQAQGFGTKEQELNAIAPGLGTILNSFFGGRLSQYREQNLVTEQRVNPITNKLELVVKIVDEKGRVLGDVERVVGGSGL